MTIDLLPLPGNAIAVLAATVLGALVGAEREWRRHPGGLCSCALVAADSCVFARIAETHGNGSTGAALGAIATGVGFIGAGAIMHNAVSGGETVRGLSTASTFWAVAAIGMAAGLLEFGMAVTLTICVLFAHVALRRVSTWIERVAPPEDAGPR